jgi:hypothetical protein
MPSFPLEAGKRCHSFLDLYLAYLEQNEISDDPGVVEQFVREAFVDDPEAVNTETFRDTMIVARIFAKSYRHDWAATIGREEWIRRVLPPDDGSDRPGTEIVGRYDRLYVEGEVGSGSELFVVRDYKTGWDAQLSTSNVFQGEVYVWMLSAMYPAMIGRLAYEVYFVRHNKIIRSKTLDEYALADIEKRIRIIRARIENAHVERAFPPTPGWHCAYCPISVRCAKRNALVRADAMIDTEESAIVALGDVVVLEAAVENRKKQLREFSKRAAPPHLPDGTVAGYDTKTSIVIRDVEGLIETLGLEKALPYLSINNKTTKRLQNDPTVAPLFIPETKSRFAIANRAAMALPAGIGGEGDEVDADGDA